jgi:hypothetical protein
MKTIGKLTVILLFWNFFTLNVAAQFNCGTPSISEMMAKDSNSFKQFDNGLREIILANATSSNSGAKLGAGFLGTDQIIPVVFHLIGNNVSSTTSDAQIQAAVIKLNQDFANTFQSTATKPSSAGNTHIKFCLAQTYTPTKTNYTSTTNGIYRWYGNHSFTSPCGGVFGTQSLDYIANSTVTGPGCYFQWPTYNDKLVLKDLTGTYESGERYLEFYVVNTICQTYPQPIPYVPPVYTNNVGGYASLPTASSPTAIDGIVIAKNGIININSPIIAHEVGHYLGLYHTFEGGYVFGSSYNNTSTPCDFFGDRCCDTPPVASLIYNGPPGQSGTPNPGKGNFYTLCSTNMNSVNESYFSSVPSNQSDMLQNYMEYGDESCKNTFTNDQIARMKYSLYYYRPILSNPQNLADAGILPCAHPIIYSNFITSLSGNPNLVEIGCESNTFDLKGIDYTTYGALYSNVTYSWSILPNTYTSPNSPLSGVNQQGISFTNAGTYTISLNLSLVYAGATYTSTSSRELIITKCNPITDKSKGNWHFSNSENVDFNSGFAQISNNSLMKTSRNTACMSNNSGNTLFYTNGRDLWYNNGTALTVYGAVFNGIQNTYNSYSSSTSSPLPSQDYCFNQNSYKSVVVLKKPLSTNQYFVITTSDFGPIQNGITLYNIDLSTGVPIISTPQKPTENYANGQVLTLVKEENGPNYWLLVRPINNLNPISSPNNLTNPNGYLLSYYVTSAGISNTPVRSKIDLPAIFHENLVISPNRKVVSIQNGVTTFAFFDCRTGIANKLPTSNISNYRNIGIFSPNSNLYYWLC